MRSCCGRGSKEGRAWRSGPPAPRRAPTSAGGGVTRGASVVRRDEELHLAQTLPDLRRILRGGGETQVLLEIRDRLGEQGEAEVDQPPVAHLRRTIGRQAHEEVLDSQGHVE